MQVSRLSRKRKENLKRSSLGMRLLSAVVLTAFGVVLIIVAFLIPPVGVIDPSVLAAYGETLTFAGALFGIDSKYRYNNRNKDEESCEE